MNYHIQTRLLLSALLAASVSACSAQPGETPPGWTRECVGRMELSMPGPVEVAAYSAKSFAKLFEPITKRSEFEFEDGQIAGYSVSARITHPLTRVQIDDLLTQAKQGFERIHLRIQKKKKSERPHLELLNLAPRTGLAYRANNSFSLTFLVGQHLIDTGGGEPTRDWSETKKELDVWLHNTHPRAIGEIPSAPGICMPYVFKEDFGTEHRSISMTYRLKKHPEITVMLGDAKSHPLSKDMNPDKFTPEGMIDFFWRQNYQDPKRVTPIWRFFRPVKLAGVPGEASLMELTRWNDQIDYGYYAVARGDPNAKEDSPNLDIYVIRDAKNAIVRGIEPMGKDEFIQLAQAIAASVKHRSVTTR